MLITSFYVPPYALNGDEFPVHIIFDNVNSPEIRLRYDKELTIREIYNVPENAFKVISGQELVVENYEVKGYVGLVFSSSISEVPYKKCNLILESKSDKQDVYEQRSIEIFKPLLEIKNVPEKITVSYDSSKREYKIDNKIIMKNMGLGSAIVNVKVNNNDTVGLAMPENYYHFLEGFRNDLASQLNNLKSHFPAHASDVDSFSQFFLQPEKIIAETKTTQIKKIFERFVHLLEANDDLAEEFVEGIVSSYLKNIQFITEISSFLEYLHSTAEGKVILTNAVEVLKAQTSIFDAGFDLGITDLALNKYPELVINKIKFEFKGTKSVPLYLLFEWKGETNMLEGGLSNDRRSR